MPSASLYRADDGYLLSFMGEGVPWNPVMGFRPGAATPDELRPAELERLGLADSLDAIVGRTVVATTKGVEVRFKVGTVWFDARLPEGFDLQLWADSETVVAKAAPHLRIRLWDNGMVTVNGETPAADRHMPRLLD